MPIPLAVWAAAGLGAAGVKLYKSVNSAKNIVDNAIARYSEERYKFFKKEEDLLPVIEELGHVPTNVYGKTKLIIEGMLADYAKAYDLRYVSLRYFNAAGAAPLGNIGEDHNPETHLIPLVLKAALGKQDHVAIFGTDYPTKDGTCIRDYIHVCDLATAHVLALDYLIKGGTSNVYNLGSQNGYSVREIIEAAKKVTGKDFPVVEKPRRAGDPAVLIASSEKIKKELHWQPEHTNIEDIIATAWRWHSSHPDGFAK